jgi:outer membrane biogenesis lipoprotein LolB
MDLDRWQASGKASFAFDDEAETARFLWQRTTADAENITLKGPFSLNAVTLLRQDGELWWQQEGELRSLSDLEGATALTRQ